MYRAARYFIIQGALNDEVGSKLMKGGMTHHAPGPPGELPQGPQRTRRSFEHPPEGSPEAEAAAHARKPEARGDVRAWCIVGAAVLLAGAAVSVYVLHAKEREAARKKEGAGAAPEEPAPFADLQG